MKAKLLLIWLLLIAGLVTNAGAEATRRRPNGRGAMADTQTALPYSLSRIIELNSANDRDPATNANYRMYRHQPSMIVSPISGDLIAAHRCGESHAGETDSICITRSRDWLSWSTRVDELIPFGDDTTMQEIASIGIGTGNRLWLIGMDVNLTPGPSTRRCWTSFSDNDGVSWSAKSFNIPETGTANVTTCGGGKGIYTANNGDLVTAGYSVDLVPPTRYVSHLFRSTNNGVTWTVTATLAIDTVDQTDQFEEPNCDRLRGTSTHMCLLRVDNEPLVAVDPNRGNIYMVRSTDDGVTWSAPVLIYQGRGTPAWGELTNGVLIAGNRSRGTGVYGAADEGWRGELWYSLNDGVSWTRGGEFQYGIDGPDDLRGGPYMGSTFVECGTNVMCIMSSQEVGTTAYSQGGLQFRYLTWGAAVPFFSDFQTSDYALRFPVGGNAALDYGAQTTLSGVTAWTMTFNWQYFYNATDLCVPTGDQPIVARNAVGGRHIDVRMLSNRRIQITLGTSLTTIASWTSPTNLPEMVCGPRMHVIISYNGAAAAADRIEVRVNNRLISGPTISGTLPASMTSPTLGTWAIGTTATRGALDDFAIWPNQSCGVDCALVLYSAGTPGDYRNTLLGTPAVYIDGETANFSSRVGSWPVPTVTGGMTRIARAGATRFSNPTATYPSWFLSSLGEPYATMLANRTTIGTSPFTVRPGNPWVETGIDIFNFGTPTLTSFAPFAQNLDSGATLGDPAGYFTDQASPVVNPVNGFLIHTINEATPNILDIRGTILAIASQFDLIADPGQFNPKGLVDLVGWVHDPTDAVASGWYWCVGATCTALGDEAPRDGRRYGAMLATYANTGTGYRLLIDLSNPQRPRVADQGTFVLSLIARFIEINASQGQFAVIAARLLRMFAATDTQAIIDGVLALVSP